MQKLMRCRFMQQTKDKNQIHIPIDIEKRHDRFAARRALRRQKYKSVTRCCRQNSNIKRDLPQPDD